MASLRGRSTPGRRRGGGLSQGLEHSVCSASMTLSLSLDLYFFHSNFAKEASTALLNESNYLIFKTIVCSLHFLFPLFLTPILQRQCFACLSCPFFMLKFNKHCVLKLVFMLPPPVQGEAVQGGQGGDGWGRLSWGNRGRKKMREGADGVF